MKPAINLELSIKALSAYKIEPNIIKSMLNNLKSIVNKNTQSKESTNEIEPLLLDFCNYVGANTPSYSVLPAKQLVKSYLKYKGNTIKNNK